MVPIVSFAQFTFTTNFDGTLNVSQYTGSGGAVTIPSSFNGLSVASIGTNAFYECNSLTNITIPNTVTNIGASAFQYCSNLTSVAIPTNINSIGFNLFYGCSNLIAITIPPSVTSIGNSAFYQCSSLTNITIPNTVSNIGDSAFVYCSSLTSVAIPTSMTLINGNLFYGCSNLTEVTIPPSIFLISVGVFAECPRLANVYFQGNAPLLEPPIASGLLFYLNTNAIVYYLPGTTGWGPTYGYRPTVLWNPQAQTGDGSFGVQNNQFGFNITGTSNLVIVVEACTNLANPTWQPIQTNTLTGGTSYFSDPQWTNYPGRFYRLSSP
jgi:hypothetical protein